MTTIGRIQQCILRALPKSGKTCLWLLKIILPISLGVRLLQYSGLLGEFSALVAPAFSVIGLPGETAIVFITSLFCPLYAPIALISSMSLGVREATILAIMCLVSHSLIVESSVQAKTGSGFWEMTVLRVVMSFVIAFCLNMVMPRDGWGVIGAQVSAGDGDTLLDVLALWLTGSVKVTATILIIVTCLMALHYVLEEFNLMKGLSKGLEPVMKVFGLPGDTAFLWLVGNLVGLAYGGAIMMEQVERKKLSAKSGNLLNYHLAVSHSLLEDTIIFVAIGIPALWIIVTRLMFAAAAVWLRRLWSLVANYYLSYKI
ncbi:MAG: nucleoside recognition domain-containing protein [Tannerellaceae bacterium]|jgi:spore maturation protein SpmB|nr:nucleoside recognition domain-containing protein [Tannerellaceae bacterium]